jgi:predicted 3-demethylubiquinone-9 3-methyltransferase (glyoxalase superfamily)
MGGGDKADVCNLVGERIPNFLWRKLVSGLLELLICSAFQPLLERSEEEHMKGINPFLWFDDQAEDAAKRYVSIFSSLGSSHSQVTDVTRYGAAGAEAAGRPEGSVMTVAFRLDGQDLVALNGSPQFQFTEAISLMVNCETQEEVDQLWERLSEGGEQGTLWLAEGQVRPVVADCPDGPRPDVAERGLEASGTRHGRHAADEEDRHPDAAAGVRAVTVEREGRSRWQSSTSTAS